MNPNQGREAAYVTSRVKDLSLITNTPDYVGLFACITPKAHSSLENAENKTVVDGIEVYLPQLIRDVDTLDELFGDPRVDPQTYKDLYAVRYIVQNGFACYVAKVRSGNPYKITIQSNGLFDSNVPINTQLDSLAELKADLQNIDLFEANSSIVGNNTLTVRLIPYKPYSINQVSLEIIFDSQATSDADVANIASTRVILTPDTKNADLVKTINAYLGGDITFSLPNVLDDSAFATVQDATDFIEPEDNHSYYCIANVLLYICGVYDLIDTSKAIVADNMQLHTDTGSTKTGLSLLTDWTNAYLADGTTFTCSLDGEQSAVLNVSQADYVRSLELYKDPKYAGCFISDLCADVTVEKEVPRTAYLPATYTLSADPSPQPDKVYYVDVSTTSTPDMQVRTEENASYLRAVYERSGEEGSYTYTEIPISSIVEGQDYYVKIDESGEAADPNMQLRTDENKSIQRALYEPATYERASASETGVVYYVKDDNGNYVVRVDDTEDPNYNATYTVNSLEEMLSDDRRGLHYIIKQVAALRKDLTCVFATPYAPKDNGGTEVYFDLNRACDWVAARGDYTDLFEYGTSNTTTYSEQAFYCEMYWSWLKWRVVKLVRGLATGNVSIIVPPTPFVILNALSSFRTRGSWYPAAGDQGGVLPDSCTILQNPSTKSQRDKLVSYRINPIFDTGLRGIQIYGNETLNPQYTDLSAAHIGRTMVYIRSRVDAYSETIKFRLNDKYTWKSWINYVSTKILDPITSLGGLTWYEVRMGEDTTTREEISQRKIRGMVSLQFTQALEIIDLEFVVYSSALELEM